MKLIVAGSREVTDFETVRTAIINAGYTKRSDISEIVSGGARGVDTIGEQFAERHNIPVKRFPVSPADWKRYGKSAAFRRNSQMAEYGDALVAIWDGKSPGTKMMIQLMRDIEKPVHVHLTSQ